MAEYFSRPSQFMTGAFFIVRKKSFAHTVGRIDAQRRHPA
ncbi:hypothetical protein LTSEHVI_5300 [Salmonella enterica subsp. enterica serovar Hvittingfoss str. A4-620]|nr:hypothetical protein LTSEHVI_5300 [Salmonella enterica subsp. enterica serovar Hvittingfoss str. A4-620]